ncbi:MAG: glycosyltransferase family 25 protein [Roseovarius sp.]|nr:glycosyltransferase family 25 protein [Roseovarius sp.]
MQIPIFIVSIHDAVKRRLQLISQLEDLNLNYELFNAVDFRNGVPQIIEHLIDHKGFMQNFSRDILSTEVGCAFSHHMIYRKIIRQNLNSAIILEDDAILSDGFAELANKDVSIKFDLLLLDHLGAYVNKNDGHELVTTSKAFILKYNKVYLTTGYLIKYSAADYLVKNTLPLSNTADWPIDITAMHCYAAYPRLVEHAQSGEGHSYIHADKLKLGKSKQLVNFIKYFKLNYWQYKKNKSKRNFYTLLK